MAGRVSAAGQVRMNAVAGPRIAQGTQSVSGQREVGRTLGCLFGHLERQSPLANTISVNKMLRA